MMAYLTAQGLAVVLLADLGFATLTGDVTVLRSVVQAAGYWHGPKGFGEAHGDDAVGAGVGRMGEGEG